MYGVGSYGSIYYGGNKTIYKVFSFERAAMADIKAIKAFEIKKHDLQPYYYFHIKDAAGNGVDLTGATVRMTMKKISGGTLVIDRQTTGISFADSANGDDITEGMGHYEWQAGDTDADGRHLIELEVTPATGGKFTFPVKRDAIVTIKQDLDDT